ncbi:hypothetical protein ACGFNU_39285 [Spirillospora sp. NPDC048911]|uniref:hypothetical protein n=1 Tax=Spirillospora sp. NPDC048911 TaxID=3364527 RepID=UPI00371BFEA4
MRGRVAERTDVIVRGRCVGWLQRHYRRHVACTPDGPVRTPDGGPAATVVDAVMLLFAALYAPAPLPDLGPGARTPRRPRNRPKTERPLCPYTAAQLATALDPPRLDGGGYAVVVDDYGERVVLGHVYRTGRRWQATTDRRRVLVHGAATRTEAIDWLLATPGPLFGDPADTVTHVL